MKRLLTILLGVALFATSVNAQMIGRPGPLVAAAAGGLDITDSFSYSDGNLAGNSNWTNILTEQVQVSSGSVYAVSPYQIAICSYADDWSNDQYSEISFDAVGSDRGGVCVRISNSGATTTGYCVFFSGLQTELVKYDGDGSPTQLDIDYGSDFTIGDDIGIGVEGTTITVYKNQVAFTDIGSSGVYTDSDYSSGDCAVYFRDTNGGAEETTSASQWKGSDL